MHNTKHIWVWSFFSSPFDSLSDPHTWYCNGPTLLSHALWFLCNLHPRINDSFERLLQLFVSALIEWIHFFVSTENVRMVQSNEEYLTRKRASVNAVKSSVLRIDRMWLLFSSQKIVAVAVHHIWLVSGKLRLHFFADIDVSVVMVSFVAQCTVHTGARTAYAYPWWWCIWRYQTCFLRCHFTLLWLCFWLIAFSLSLSLALSGDGVVVRFMHTAILFVYQLIVISFVGKCISGVAFDAVAAVAVAMASQPMHGGFSANDCTFCVLVGDKCSKKNEMCDGRLRRRRQRTKKSCDNFSAS